MCERGAVCGGYRVVEVVGLEEFEKWFDVEE